MAQDTPQYKENLAYFHKAFTDLMNFRNVKQVEIVEATNIPKTTLNGYARGTSIPNPGNVQKIADFFNVKKSDIDIRFSDEQDRIRKLKSIGLYQESIADKIVSVTNKLNEPRQEKVYDFAISQLNEQSGNVNESESIYLVGQTAAGSPIEYSQLNIEQINTTIPKGADYALTVRGDSMEPLIKDGSIIFYKEQPTVENGEVAIIEIDRNEVTCKKFYFNGEKIILRSINDKYEDMIFDRGVRIIGKVIL